MRWFYSIFSVGQSLPESRGYPLPRIWLSLARRLLPLAGFSVLASALSAQTEPGTVIRNQAIAVLSTPAGSQVFPSNLDQFEVGQFPTRSAAAIYPAGAGPRSASVQPTRYADVSGNWITLPYPEATSGFAASALVVNYRDASSTLAGGYVLVKIEDRDQNLRFQAEELITVTVRNQDSTDEETLQLRETGANTGIFAGLIRISRESSAPADGRIFAQKNSAIELRYTDPRDSADIASSTLLIDPFGFLFDSSTGERLDGASITLLDATTGQPAEVFSFDGVTRFPSTLITGQNVQDSAGATFALDTGQFVFPLVRPGRYRYRVELPPRSGYSFPSTANDAALAATPGGPFVISAASRGGEFEVLLDPVRTDIPVDPSASSLLVRLNTSATTAATGDFLLYEIEVSNLRATPFNNVVVTDQLPRGFRLETTSLLLNGARLTPTLAPDGHSFQLTLPTLSPAQTARITYIAHAANPAIGQAVTRVHATASHITSNTATATVLVRDELMATRSHIFGRVQRHVNGRATGEGIPGVGLYLETGTMSVTDARGFFRFEGVTPGVHVVQLDTATLPAGAKPFVLPGDNQAAGNPLSRFVDLAPGSAWNVLFPVEISATSPVTTPPIQPAPAISAPTYDRGWLERQSASFDWLLPRADDAPPLPSTKILVKHSPGHKVRVLLNGQPVNPANFEGTLTDRTRPLAASLWLGVNLQEGDNTFEVIRTDSFGIERGREKRVVHFASPPVRAEFVPADSRLIADGITPPVIAVRFLDRTGRPARQGVTGAFAVAAPYTVERTDKNDLRLAPGAPNETDRFTIGDNGIARITLAPTTTTGTVRIQFPLMSGEQEIRADLRGERKEWILVGVASGTAAHRTIDGHLESAAADQFEDGLMTDDRVALFAKGRIRGGWLLTAAYDSKKEKNSPRALHHGIEPDAYYTVYGDESERQEHAPSRSKLYVKLERDAVTALFGDYALDWRTTGFTTYSRQLHGVKADYKGEKLRATVFQSDAGLRFNRDELRGTGLSGPYNLSRRRVVPNSETIILEERDRVRPDLVVASKSLSRGLDYALDYSTGALRLSQPLMPNTLDGRAQYLVVRYELEDETVGTVTGARAEYQARENLTVGAAHMREDYAGRTATVTGADATLKLNHRFTARAEAAQSENLAGTSDAYKAELARNTESTDTRVYYESAGVGFGLGQLNAAQTGRRQFGLDASQRLTSTVSAQQSLFQEELLTTGDRRQAGEAQLEYRPGAWSYRAGLKAAEDLRRATPGSGFEADESQQALLLTSGIGRSFFAERLRLRLDREQTLRGENENLDFPTRTVFGAAYDLNASTSLLAEQEWSEAQNRRTNQTRIGLKARPWTGGTLTSGFNHDFARTHASALGGGLGQTFPITPTLTLDGGFQRSQVIQKPAETTSQARAATPFHSTSGFANGSEGNSTAGHFGAQWQPGAVRYQGRVEVSDTDNARRTGFLASAQTEAGRDLGLLASLIASRQTLQSGVTTHSLDARFGAAWRPVGSDTILLNRFDIVCAPVAEDLNQQHTWKLIENLHFNRILRRDLQTSLHLGAKYVLTPWAGGRFDSVSTLLAWETRWNFTPKWDLGAQTSLLSGWRADQHRTSYGLSVGRSFAKNVWVSVGYNFNGFADRDFTAARYTAAGAYVRFRIKFDQESLGGLLNVIKFE